MLKRINIEECYFVLISRYVGYKQKSNEMALINSNKVKFTIVKYDGCAKYKDIISDEQYKTGANNHDKIGMLFINDDYFILPLNSLIKLDNKFINEKKLLKLVREPLMELTSLLYTDERGKIMNVKTLQDKFSEAKQKQLNNLNIRRSKR